MYKLAKEEGYSIISRTTANTRSLCIYIRRPNFEQLLNMQEKLNTVIEEYREDAKREAAEHKKLETKCQQVFEYIVSVGLDPEEWQDPVSTIVRTVETERKPEGGVRKAKYILKDRNGETRTRSSNGKMSLALWKQVNGDCISETFLIENPNQHGQSGQNFHVTKIANSNYGTMITVLSPLPELLLSGRFTFDR